MQIDHIPLRDGETPGAVVQADITTLEELLPYGIHPAAFRTLEEVVEDTVPYYFEYLKHHEVWRDHL